MKTCICCHKEKPINEYYRHKGMKDGRLNKCKDCVRHYSKKQYHIKKHNNVWINEERERHCVKYYRLNYKEKHKPDPDKKRKIMEAYLEKYPEKKAATTKVGNAIRAGKLIKQTDKEAHHWSYSKAHWLNVFWLTTREHNEVHRSLDYDKKKFCYRNKYTGELLDTRQKHEEFINSILSERNIKTA